MARTPPSGMSTPRSRNLETIRERLPTDPVPVGLSTPADRTVEEMRSPVDVRIEELLSSYERINPLSTGCTRLTRQGVVGIAVAGCAVVGLDLGYR